MTKHERRSRRSFAAPIAWIALALLLIALPACSKADTSTMLDDLGGAASGTDELVSVEIEGNTYVLNVTQSTLSKLGSGKRKASTVPVADGGTPQLLAAEHHLAVLDASSGLVEWFELKNLTRRTVTLGDGRWQAAIDDRAVVFALEQRGGELVRVEAEGGQRRTKATDPETTATVSVIDEGVLVRDLARRQDVVFDRDALAQLRSAPINDLGDGTILPAVGPDAANWVLNATTGELIGLGMEKGWRGKVAVGVGSDGFDPPLVIGDWAYVHRPDAGRVVVVRTANGALAGVVDTGVTGTQLLAEGDHATIVQVERGYAATLKGTDLRVLRSKDASGVALPNPVVNTTRAAEAVKEEPATVDPKVTTSSGSDVPTTPVPSTGTNPSSTATPTTGSGTPAPTPTPKDLNPACSPSAAPSGVTLSATEPTVAVVRWSISSKTCLRGFRVQWGSNSTYLGQIDLGRDVTEHTITGLPSAARTEVDLFSLDDAGKVVDATRQRVQADMPPKCPPASPAGPTLQAQGPTVAVVSWSIPSTECLGGFRVQWGTDADYLGRVDLGPDATTHTISDLPPDATTEVDLFALDLGGRTVDGSRQRLSVQMPPEVACPPLAPGSPSIAAVDGTTVSVRWTVASAECLAGFRLQWGASAQFLGSVDLGAGATEHTVSGFPPGAVAEVDLFSIGRDGKVVDGTRQALSVQLPV